MCELKFDPSTKEYSQGTCPKDNFCFPHPHVFSLDNDARYGHCCPVVPTVGDVVAKIVCPVGSILANASCNILDANSENACTMNSNYDCVDSHSGKEKMCCPTACSRSQGFATENSCYDYVAFNEPCFLDRQCAARTRYSRCKETQKGLSVKIQLVYMVVIELFH